MNIYTTRRRASLGRAERRMILTTGLMVLPAILTSCGDGITREPRIKWAPIDSLNARLPDAVRVYSGIDNRWPLRAWYVAADLSSPSARGSVVMSDEVDAVETASSLADDLGACVVVNGGFFRMDLHPARHVGLLMIDSVMVSRPTPSVLRQELRYSVTRAALGFYNSGQADIGWASVDDSMLVEWTSPVPNRPARPADSLAHDQATPWPVVDAVAGGPVLISEGRIRVTADEEVFFGSAIPKVHPRTAVGITRAGLLILLVVDGRQMESSGVDLEDLASIMLDLGAYEAMNLDGGGSSTLVVEGVRLNVPAGSETEREVMSAIAIECSP
jgi:exopolysaccharide biosynthesis protein